MHSSPPETRASLILRLRDPADVLAWDEFTTIYAPSVFRLARRYGLQQADADDLVQEVLAAVAKSVSQWLDREQRSGFRGWLFRIARNTSIDFLTRRKHRPWSVGGEDAARQFDDVAASEEVSGDFDIEYRREVFHWASERVRDSVSETTWLAFWLSTIEDQPIKDVAKEVEMSVGSVYIARSRVMKRLRHLVKQYEGVHSNDNV